MKRVWPLAALGVLAYLVLALITLPANVVIPRLQHPGMTLAGLDGTIWKGSAQVLQIGDAHLGSISWNLHVLPLFALRTVADVDLRRTDGFARGRVSAGRWNVRLTDFTASLPLSALPSTVAPGGWSGTFNARLVRLTLAEGWPIDADGTIDILELTGPARRPNHLGSFRLTFPGETQPSESLTGELRDTGGPLQVTGTVRLDASERSYFIEGWVSTKPETPAEFARTLEFLGPADAQGRRQFSLSGTM